MYSGAVDGLIPLKILTRVHLVAGVCGGKRDNRVWEQGSARASLVSSSMRGVSFFFFTTELMRRERVASVPQACN